MRIRKGREYVRVERATHGFLRGRPTTWHLLDSDGSVLCARGRMLKLGIVQVFQNVPIGACEDCITLKLGLRELGLTRSELEYWLHFYDKETE